MFKNVRLILIDAGKSKSEILFAFFILQVYIAWIDTFLHLWRDNKLFCWTWRSNASESLRIIFNDIVTLLWGISDIFLQFFEFPLLKFVSIFA